MLSPQKNDDPGKHRHGMHKLQLGELSATVSACGAELRSLQRGGEEYLWQNKSGLWAGSAPILVPHVGRLRDGGFVHVGRFHALPLHGFAHQSEFKLIAQSPQALTLALRASAHTRECYPFDFELRVSFTLRTDGLAVDYRVRNRGLERMAFSLGSHPGFALPLDEGEGLNAWHIEFDAAEAPEVYRLDGALLGTLPQPFEFKPRQTITLGPQLFDADALVFKNLNSRLLTLAHRRKGTRLRLHTGGAPHLGLWSRPGAAYICIEPWFGVDDDAQTPLELLAKPAAIQLAPGRAFVAGYRVEF